MANLMSYMSIVWFYLRIGRKSPMCLVSRHLHHHHNCASASKSKSKKTLSKSKTTSSSLTNDIPIPATTPLVVPKVDSFIIVRDHADHTKHYLGKVFNNDYSPDEVIVHYYNAYPSKNGTSRRYRPVYDSGDGKEIYTDKPLPHYEPMHGIVQLSHIVVRDIVMEKYGRIPTSVLASVPHAKL